MNIIIIIIIIKVRNKACNFFEKSNQILLVKNPVKKKGGGIFNIKCLEKKII